MEPADGEEGNNSDESKQSDADVEDNEDQESTQPAPEEAAPRPEESSEPKLSQPLVIDELGVAHGNTRQDKEQGDKVAVVDDRGGGESGYATNGGTHSNSPGSPTSATEEIDPSHPSALCSELASLALGEKREETKEKQEKVEDTKVSVLLLHFYYY